MVSRRRTFRHAGAAALAFLLIAGCAREPYVFNPSEFDREDPNFAKPLKDRDSVEICYTSQTTTPQDILAMAEAECARFGKSARLNRQDTLICPIVTPVRAVFACVPR